MAVTLRDYPPCLVKELVELPEPVVTFFKQRGKYVWLPHAGDLGVAITYKAIEGQNPTEVPPEYFNDDTLIQTVEEYPFTNKIEKDKELADKIAVAALKFLFGAGTKYGDIEKRYMINTSTQPIKVQFSEKGKGSKKVMYVKRPDVNRIIGRFLYEIISGIPPIRYGFNRTVFLEEGISGNTLSRLDEIVYLQAQVYREGIMKAAVHADTLGLFRDVQNPRNRIVDSKLRTVLFDFNLIFRPKSPGEKNFLLEPYLRSGFISDGMVQVYLEEQHNIATRVEKHHKAFFKLVGIVGELEDVTQMSVNARIRQYYGARSLEEYFEKRVEEFRRV